MTEAGYWGCIPLPCVFADTVVRYAGNQVVSKKMATTRPTLICYISASFYQIKFRLNLSLQYVFLCRFFAICALNWVLNHLKWVFTCKYAVLWFHVSMVDRPPKVSGTDSRVYKCDCFCDLFLRIGVFRDITFISQDVWLIWIVLCTVFV